MEYTDSRPELPPPDTAAVDLELGDGELAALRRRSHDEGVAPEDDQHLVRYLIYLGAAYLRAEHARTDDPEDAWDRIRRSCDAAKSAGAVLRFHYGEAARTYSSDTRAIVAEEHFVASFAPAVDAMAEEVERRRERIAALEETLAAR